MYTGCIRYFIQCIKVTRGYVSIGSCIYVQDCTGNLVHCYHQKINNNPVSILIDALKNMNETEGIKHNVHLKYFLMASVDML